MLLKLLLLSLGIVLAGALGGLLEPHCPGTKFPETWMTPGARSRKRYPWNERMLTGLLAGIAFVVLFCGFASCNVAACHVEDSLTISMFLKSLIFGVVGTRLVRMRATIPMALLWKIIRDGLAVQATVRPQVKRGNGRSVRARRR